MNPGINKEDDKKYIQLIAGRIPDTVFNAVDKFIMDQREEYPSYNEATFVRAATVYYLKEKGYLDKKKKYL